MQLTHGAEYKLSIFLIWSCFCFELTALRNHTNLELDLFDAFDTAAGVTEVRIRDRGYVVATFSSEVSNDTKIKRALERWTQRDPWMGCPRSDTLLVLVKINVFRALLSNSQALNIPPHVVVEDTARSPFCNESSNTNRIIALPQTLRPTPAQTRIEHHPWIDCIPIPQMRENLIRAGRSLDEMKLCGDLVGLFSEGNGLTALIFWSEAWDLSGIEVTEDFVEYWGWTITGCWDLFKSTNSCRAKRGERPIDFRSI